MNRLILNSCLLASLAINGISSAAMPAANSGTEARIVTLDASIPLQTTEVSTAGMPGGTTLGMVGLAIVGMAIRHVRNRRLSS